MGLPVMNFLTFSIQVCIWPRFPRWNLPRSQRKGREAVRRILHETFGFGGLGYLGDQM